MGPPVVDLSTPEERKADAEIMRQSWAQRTLGGKDLKCAEWDQNWAYTRRDMESVGALVRNMTMRVARRETERATTKDLELTGDLDKIAQNDPKSIHKGTAIPGDHRPLNM